MLNHSVEDWTVENTDSPFQWQFFVVSKWFYLAFGEVPSWGTSFCFLSGWGDTFTASEIRKITPNWMQKGVVSMPQIHFWRCNNAKIWLFTLHFCIYCHYIDSFFTRMHKKLRYYTQGQKKCTIKCKVCQSSETFF